MGLFSITGILEQSFEYGIKQIDDKENYVADGFQYGDAVFV